MLFFTKKSQKIIRGTSWSSSISEHRIANNNEVDKIDQPPIASGQPASRTPSYLCWRAKAKQISRALTQFQCLRSSLCFKLLYLILTFSVFFYIHKQLRRTFSCHAFASMQKENRTVTQFPLADQDVFGTTVWYLILLWLHFIKI